MSYIKVDKAKIVHNLELIKSHVGSFDKIAVVLKDDAYGHGALNVAKICFDLGIKRAIVRHEREAVEIKDFFENILILTGGENSFHEGFEYTINDICDIQYFNKNSKVHIKVDTGMHRNGVDMDSIEQCMLKCVEKNIQICGVFTHYRSADILSSEFFWQFKNFETVKKRVIEYSKLLNISLPKFHSCNSSATFRLKNIDDDFVRIGIAMYGYLDMGVGFEKLDLKPAMSLFGEKISTRTIKKGQRVGYGGVFEAPKDMVISAYDVGYGDGFFRANERKKIFTKDGREILGKVSMDNILVEGDSSEICIFNDVSAIAKEFDTISYDICVKLSKNIKRICDV
ncbi:MAG: alanine racemase [Campylobacterales bacterium]|nr:alanine racemase [Campylobacterales bacterium]